MEMTGLPSGTVYPAMRRLERDELIRSHWERQSIADAEQRPPRKYYKLTRRQSHAGSIAQALSAAGKIDSLRGGEVRMSLPPWPVASFLRSAAFCAQRFPAGARPVSAPSGAGSGSRNCGMCGRTCARHGCISWAGEQSGHAFCLGAFQGRALPPAPGQKCGCRVRQCRDSARNASCFLSACWFACYAIALLLPGVRAERT
jgi:hypothetical protein